MRVPQPVLLVIGWLLIVTASSSLSWAVISKAGQSLGTGTDQGGSYASDTSWPTPTPSEGPTEEFPTPNSTPVSLTKTWVGVAGRVSAACLSGQISLTGAEPNVGYRVVVGNTGPVNISVQFVLSDGTGTQVDSTCGTAGPAFTTRKL